MEQLFTPKVARPTDNLSAFFTKTNRFLLLALLAVTPLVFVPGMVGSFKTFFAVFIVLLSVAVGSFGILRQGMIPRFVPVILLAWLGVVLSAFVSAVLSKGVVYSLRGDALETYTVSFLLLIGVIMLLVYSFGNDKKTAMWMIIIPAITATILSVHQLLRFFFSGTFLDFGVLATPSDTLIGAFNDLGIFLTASILIILVAVIQLSLPKKVLVGVLVLVGLNLSVLAVINVGYIWVVLGLISLSLLMFLLTKDRFMGTAGSSTSVLAVIIMALVFMVSALFFVTGSSIGASVSKFAGVNYIEVRPSVTATLDIMRSTLSDNVFTGIGPNRFADAWELYKDESINQTMFWNTGFASGSSYVFTWFATTGIIGVIAWVAFFCVFVYRGFRTLFTVENRDKLWFFIATTSFILSLYLWGTMWLYASGPFILIFAGVMTGLYLVAEKALLFYDEAITPKLFTSSRAGFALIGVVMIVIVMTVATSYTVSRQFLSLTTYVNAASKVEGENALEIVTGRIAQAYSYYSSDIYLRGIISYQLVALNNLLALEEPNANQKQEFNDIVRSLISVAGEAVALRPFHASNLLVMGDVYSILSQLGIERAGERAKEVYQKAMEIDPTNPYYLLQIGLLNVRSDDREAGRAKITEALGKKQNYIEALAVLAQLDIEDGNIEQAVRVTEAIVVLEPNNPGRLYQLALLYGAAKNRQSAINILNRAIELNPQFANARYLLALHFYADDKYDEAIAELEVVRAMDEKNSAVDEVIAQMRARTLTPDFTLTKQVVNEPNNVSVQEDVVTASEVSDSDLISSVNTPVRSSNESSSNPEGVATTTEQ